MLRFIVKPIFLNYKFVKLQIKIIVNKYDEINSWLLHRTPANYLRKYKSGKQAKLWVFVKKQLG